MTMYGPDLIPSNIVATRDNFESLLDAGQLQIRLRPAHWATLHRKGPTSNGSVGIWYNPDDGDGTLFTFIGAPDFNDYGVLNNQKFRVMEPRKCTA